MRIEYQLTCCTCAARAAVGEVVELEEPLPDEELPLEELPLEELPLEELPPEEELPEEDEVPLRAASVLSPTTPSELRPWSY